MQMLFAALSLLSALIFAQIPEVVQQYRQRLGGAADQLTTVVRNFDEDSRRSGYVRAVALSLMKTNPERFVREQGQRMEDYISRRDRLTSQQAMLANGVTVASVISVVFNYDPEIMSQALAAYEWAFPLSAANIFFALVGLICCYGPLLLLGSIFGLRENAEA